MVINQISIFAENRKGRLAEITKIIADNNVDIHALSIADTTNFGVLRIIVDNSAEVERILRENNITVSVTSVVAVNIEDRPGGLYEMLKLLSDNDIPVEYMYHAFFGSEQGSVCIIMRIEDDIRAQSVLSGKGYSGPDYQN